MNSQENSEKTSREQMSEDRTDRSQTDRISWPRDRLSDGTPVVGYTCDNCGEEVEDRYEPARLARCPNCGGNQSGVRGWSVESVVEDRRDRLRDQLAQQYGPAQYPSEAPECFACGATEDLQICPGEALDDLQYRCDDCRRFPKWWWQPGEHPSLLARDWIDTCDDCGAEFTGIFGITFWIDHGRRDSHSIEDYCLRCANPERVRQFLEVMG